MGEDEGVVVKVEQPPEGDALALECTVSQEWSSCCPGVAWVEGTQGLIIPAIPGPVAHKRNLQMASSDIEQDEAVGESSDKQGSASEALGSPVKFPDLLVHLKILLILWPVCAVICDHIGGEPLHFREQGFSWLLLTRGVGSIASKPGLAMLMPKTVLPV